MKRTLILVTAVAAILGACSSKQADIRGFWKNSMRSTLRLEGDSTAVMGEVGTNATARGTFERKGDTVFVKSLIEADSGVVAYNLFTLRYKDDSLFLVRIGRYRAGDYQTLEGTEFARRLGQTPEQMAFTRVDTTKK